MIAITRSNERGTSNLGWLKSRHTFSFGQYFNPNRMGFESLRVINDDRVAPGTGFGTHPHNNMEIISYVLEGALEHKDSMGNGSIIKPGEVQRLSAGTGITHSEFNHSKNSEVHFLQIWFVPDTVNTEPAYAQQAFDELEKRGRFRLVASKQGRDGSITLYQDVDMSVALIDEGEEIAYAIAPDRTVWVHIARGQVAMNDTDLKAGDGAAINGESLLKFRNAQDAEVILFDMAPLNT
jgi:redox-sensitive bicupin YhaK (pirin superfamily)